MVQSGTFTQCIDQLRAQNEEWKGKVDQLQYTHRKDRVFRERALRAFAQHQQRRKELLTRSSQLEEENKNLMSELERMRAHNAALASQGHLAMKTMRKWSQLCGSNRDGMADSTYPSPS